MYHIIFNPKSKGSRGKDVCRIVLAQLKIRSLPFILHTTDHPRHVLIVVYANFDMYSPVYMGS